jgi:hypothetical protein
MAISIKSEIARFSALDIAKIVFPLGAHGVYMIFALYGDDSTDKLKSSGVRDRILSAGAFLGWPETFFEAERHWEARLKKDNIDYFRASECEGLVGEFDPFKRGMSLNSGRAMAESVRRDLCDIIVKANGLAGFAVSVVLDEFLELLETDSRAKPYFGDNPAIMIYVALIKQAIAMCERDFAEVIKWVPIAFTFDTHTKWKEAEEAYSQLKKVPMFEKRLGYIGHADDKIHAPLQMADLMAHEARHKTAAFISGSNKTRTSFEVLAGGHNVYYCGLLRKEDMIAELDQYVTEKK